MDLQRIAQQFKGVRPPVRARFGSVVQVNSDYTVDVLVGGMTTDAEEEAAYNSGFIAMNASGGTLGTAEDLDGIEYRTHTFTTAGTLVVGTAGTNAVLEAFVVGGGGAGGGGGPGVPGGGGGAGRVVVLSLDPALGNYVASIGTAGAGAKGANGGSGGNTQVTLPDTSVVIATGGGGGGTAAGVAGASGGGAGATSSSFSGGTASGDIGYGNAGGRSFGASVYTGRSGGGGGGATGAGRDATSAAAGPISPGLLFNGIIYGQGGEGGSFVATGLYPATRTAGIGGNLSNGGNAVSNTGSGGGGGSKISDASFGGNGGSGVVIFRYRITPDDIVPNSEVTVTSDQVSGIKYLGRGVPLPGQTVLLLTDGQDLLAVDSLAQSGSTISPRRYRTTNLSITQSVDTVVTWGTAVANDLLGMSGPVGGTAWNTRLYSHIPGWYRADASVSWSAEGGSTDLWVRLNGTATVARQSESLASSSSPWQSVSTPTFYMAKDDYVEVLARVSQTRNLTYQSEYAPSFSLTFVGP